MLFIKQVCTNKDHSYKWSSIHGLWYYTVLCFAIDESVIKSIKDILDNIIIKKNNMKVDNLKNPVSRSFKVLLTNLLCFDISNTRASLKLGHHI